jgi:hypothetical protein
MLKLQRSTSIAILFGAAVLAGCAKKDDAAVDTTADTAAVTTAPPAPTPVNLADVAGKWNVRAVPSTGTDTTPTNSVITATSTTSGWTITFPGRQPIPLKVTVDADSIMTEAGPYPSVRRRGTQVSTNGVMRLQGGSLVGSTTAHFKVKTPDSVLVLTTTATRAP